MTMGFPELETSTLTLYRHTPRQGGAGGQKESLFVPDQTAAGIMASVQPASATTRLEYMQNRMVVSHSLFFDTNYAPNLNDRWQTDDGLRVFIVQGWIDLCEQGEVFQCDCREQRVPRSPAMGSATT